MKITTCSISNSNAIPRACFLFFVVLSMLSVSHAQYETKKDPRMYFKKSYEESRQQFLESVMFMKKKDIYEVTEKSYPDPVDNTLTTDTALFKVKSRPSRNLIVVMSGLHGIEGYVGSALQSKMIDENLITDRKTSDFLFIHALNPYGFKNNRRVNRNNIDLNRNFVVDEKDYQAKSPDYAEINSFLNPEENVNFSFFSRIIFIFKSVKIIIQHSLKAVREAVLKGQYQFSHGVFYGGNTYQYQKKMIDEIAEVFPKYDKVFTLDLHTGYGQRSKLHVLASSKKQPSAPKLNVIFGEDRIDYGDKKEFYHTTGDLITYLQTKSTPKTEVIGATFEFGTLNSQKLFGSIESLRRTVLENQNFHYAIDQQTTDQVNSLFQDMFYPNDEEFEKAVFSQSDVEFKKITDFYQ